MNKVPDILDKIIRTKKKEVSELIPNLNNLEKSAFEKTEALDFKKALSKNSERLSVIAEIKQASPSAGVISENFDHIQTALEYSNAEVDAISVLTDKKYFQGSNNYLKDVKNKVKNIPVLRKDFIIDKSQIYESRIIGADTFLLIAACLSLEEMKKFILLGRELGMKALCEAHNHDELQKCIDAGAEIIGINNRNLRTFKVDINNSVSAADKIPSNCIKVSESGIKSLKDCRIIRKAGFDAILVGESFMKCSSANFADFMKKIKTEI